ncbi:hypothetical protein J2X78_005098 [Pedobacter africanus]|uniref:Uncharacterized protein n=1 Tax=Pedobacter africanus TaxID=151894 RepID=A0ACC6L525_9SPHI|nr:hypothetical protein [Pedobacter africanus]
MNDIPEIGKTKLGLTINKKLHFSAYLLHFTTPGPPPVHI